MPKNTDFRDYLYISVRKVIRMSRTLHTPLWKRVRDLQIKLGPVGAAVTLDMNSRAEDVIALLPEVENAIEEQLGITYYTDPELQVGQWFLIEAVPTIYGIPRRSSFVGTVLFVGGEEDCRFILGGSAGYLLDREVAAAKTAEFPPSALVGIDELLYALQLESYGDPGNDDQEDQINERWSREEGSDQRRSRYALAFRVMEEVFRSRPEPLTTLARCLDLHRYGDTTTIIGTPLYVAFHAPQ